MKSNSLKHLGITLSLAISCTMPAYADPVDYVKLGVPDFGQEVKSAWGNSYCAPTASADSVWWFSQHGYPALANGFSTGNDNGANYVIDSLASLMGTTPYGGTLAGNIAPGLQSYLDYFYPGIFHVRLVSAQDVGGGAALWAAMKKELLKGEDIIPLISWYGLGGHAVEMTGYHDNLSLSLDESISINDPWSNNSSHNWSGEYLSLKITAYGAGGIALDPNWSTGDGYIWGFVDASPIPDSNSVQLLIGTALLAMLSGMKFAKRRY